MNLKNLSQSGIALPLVLILMLIMTLLAIATLNTTILEDQMAGNSRQREIAFNAAETTLRFGEEHAAGLVDDIRGGELLGSDGSLVRLFDGGAGVQSWPDNTATHPGDTCTGGYCIPLQYHQDSSTIPVSERWEDTTLNVWNTAARHHEFTDFSSSGMATDGIFEAPKYIIEYMGDYNLSDSSGLPIFEGPTCDPADSSYISESAEWPFCDAAPSLFRVTARVLAGPPGRESVVILQSTIRVPK